MWRPGISRATWRGRSFQSGAANQEEGVYIRLGLCRQSGSELYSFLSGPARGGAQPESLPQHTSRSTKAFAVCQQDSWNSIFKTPDLPVELWQSCALAHDRTPVCHRRLWDWSRGEDDHETLALLHAALHQLQTVCEVRQKVACSVCRGAEACNTTWGTLSCSPYYCYSSLSGMLRLWWHFLNHVTILEFNVRLQ